MKTEPAQLVPTHRLWSDLTKPLEVSPELWAFPVTLERHHLSRVETKQRASYFTEIEQQVLLGAYEEDWAVINKKSNTLISAKTRELARQRIADRVNA